MKRFILPALLALAIFPAAPSADDDADLAAREALAARFGGILASEIAATPIPGVYEVRVGPNLVYVSADGRYLLRGQLVDLQTQTDLTNARRNAVRAAWVAGLDESTMVVFEPPGEVAHTLTVFTDTECGYCRRFHAEIDQLLSQGVRVRYLFHPALSARSFEQAEAIWCAADRRDAMTRAKLGRRIRATDCGESPVERHLALSRDLGIRGTPMMVTDSGGEIRGYLPPAELLAQLRRFAQATADR